MSTLESRIDTLTKEQVKFLRRPLETVVFRFSNGRTTLEVKDKATGAELTLDCKFHYDSYGRGNGVNCKSAFAMIHTPSFTWEWLTVVKLLKAGDSIELDWMADGHSNQYTKSATGNDSKEGIYYEELHIDNLRLHILRKDSKDRLQRELTFQLIYGACPNNSARMIQQFDTGR